MEMLKAGRNPRSNDMSLVIPPLRHRVDAIYGMPLLRCSTATTLREPVANHDDAIRMCQQEIANPGFWVKPCEPSENFFVYQVYAQNSQSHDPSQKQFYLVRICKAGCQANSKIRLRAILYCNCGGYHQLGKKEIKRLCKHCGLVMLLCRYGWHQQLVSCSEANRLGPRARAVAARAPRSESSETEPHTIAERLQQLEDFVEVRPNVARSSRLNDSLIVSIRPHACG